MSIYDQRMEFRCDKEMRQYLLGLNEDQSKYIRDLINQDRLKKADPKIIDQKIEEHKQEIQKLQNIKKIKPDYDKKIQEFLTFHAPNYKLNAPHRREAQRVQFIEKAIMPNLKKWGYTGTVQDIDNLLLNWPEQESKVVINV